MKPGGFKLWVNCVHSLYTAPYLVHRGLDASAGVVVELPQLRLVKVGHPDVERYKSHLKKQTLKPCFHLIGARVETG